ncbi:hypothetical protein RJ639_021309 [Escallonia herrerae]|uniref:RNase H type-1 domain-containing protein n=1 Tax=Escallonia herrerae TaxID=1293975 RepID=A0AA88V277_9ASTE|nr:hypothetical protein RJ639_021309 [Escallonia herrerae]
MREDTPLAGREAAQENAGVINTISGGITPRGSSRQRRKAYAREVLTTMGPSTKKQKVNPAPTISFSDEDVGDIKTPHDDPLVVTLQVGNSDMKRILVDNGSSAEENQEKTVRIGIGLADDLKHKLVDLLRSYSGIFAWTTSDMPGIDPKWHTIVVLTDQPLGKVLQNPDASGRLVNWSMELGEFDIKYRFHAAIKAQALLDFVVECTVQEDPLQLVLSEVSNSRLLYVDDSSKVGNSGARLILFSPEKFMIEYALCFDFQASNNEAEYEALSVGIRLAHSLRVDSLSVHSDSQLIVNHILGEYGVKDDRMAQYLQEVKIEAAKFKNFAIRHIPRDQNAQADSLSKLTSVDISEFSQAIYIEFLLEISIQLSKEIDVVEYEPCWMDLIIHFLISGKLPQSKAKHAT